MLFLFRKPFPPSLVKMCPEVVTLREIRGESADVRTDANCGYGLLLFV